MKRKFIKKIFGVFLCLGIVGIAVLAGVNLYVKQAVKDRIVDLDTASELQDMDCILVLGCQVKEDGSPSLMLRDRLNRGVELYQAGAAPKLLMSGDHGRTEYNEVGTMKQFAIDAQVPSENVFMDHAGFSTYESIYRAKDIFEAESLVIVTQEYHLYRALYIAEKLGVEAYGVAADGQNYVGQFVRDTREALARVKDFVTVIVKPKPTYLGEAISIETNGDLTNDKVEEETKPYTENEIQNMDADTVLDEKRLNGELVEASFYSTEITEEIKERIWNISYKENDNISLDELRYLRVLHRGFDENTHIGELIVNQSIADDILEIMCELYKNDYPIEKMVLVDEYHGDDEASMEDNNTSAFNYRVVSGTSTLSKHSMGMALDINPKYNPYVVKRASGEISISPESGKEYADRSREFSYKLDEDDLCVQLFVEHGFTWGGNWKSVKDYQHFEK